MGILKVVGDIVSPITNLIDSLHTSGEEKSTLRNELERIEQSFAAKVLEYEMQILTLRSNIIVAEAQGQSWMQRSWRPITMLTFLALAVLDAFGWLPFRLAPEAWLLLQLGLGGYVVGRSAEKIIPSIIGQRNTTTSKEE
jgi:hypothetical protein